MTHRLPGRASPESPLVDAAGTRHAPATGRVRIVSLVPSLTELVCELGLGAKLVGRTGFCVHPREALRHVPKVGGTKDVKIDRVRALSPTHLIVNIDENRREDVAQMATFVPHVIVTHPLRPEDNLALYALFGAIFGCERQALRLAALARESLGALHEVAARLARQRVLYLVWRDPWIGIARDTYISATMAAAGWDSLPEAADARYPVLRLDEPWLGQVERVLLPSEPYRFRARDVADIARMDRLAGKPVELIDGEMTSWYGSRAIAGLRDLARLRERLAIG